MAKYLAQDLSQASAGYLLVAMGSGRSSFASQVQQARVADLQKVVADFTPEESEKVKVALKQVLPANRRQRRVRGGGKTENCRSLAPTFGRTDLAEEPARTKDFKPASSLVQRPVASLQHQMVSYTWSPAGLHHPKLLKDGEKMATAMWANLIM